MGESLVLAIDQGGHASRALVFDRAGRILARSSVGVAERRAGEDRVEQDPEELVRSVELAIGSALAELGPRAEEVTCAGLATQRSSLVCWDRESGTALSPVISWQDRRAHAWLERFSARAAEIRERTGLRLSPHYGASKLRWCLDHLPEVSSTHARGRLACGPLASFLAGRLCRERPFVADPANAQRTLLFGLAELDWDPELLALFDVPRAVLPHCVPTRARHGTLVSAGHEVPLEILTGDQPAAVFAWGEPREDTLYVNLGTGAFVQRPVRRRPAGPSRLLASIVAREGDRRLFAVEGTVNGAGSALRAVAGELGIDDAEAELSRALDEPTEPPLFLNGISGLGAPYWVPDLRSRFIGEGSARAKLAAVGESIMFLVHAILEEIALAFGRPARILASGGLAAVDGLCQRLADLAGVPVERALEAEATAQGLAWLLGARPGNPTLRCFSPGAAPGLHLRARRFKAELERALSEEH